MKNIQNFISVNDYCYVQDILLKTLNLYKTLMLYIKLCPNDVVKSHLVALKNNSLEQFNQIISVLQVQDEN